MKTYGLVLERGDDGHGGWSLHPPASTDAQIRSGEAPPLASGPAVYLGSGRWSGPTQGDYDGAARQEHRGHAIAVARAHLPLSGVGQIGESHLIRPEMLILPEEWVPRVQRVDTILVNLLRAASANPRIMYSMPPHQFEEFIATLIEHIGFSNVVLTPRSHDGGKDITARKIVHGIPLSCYFECKRYAADHKVPVETLRALLGVVAHDARSVNIGVLVTTSSFTADAHALLRRECRLDGKDYAGITELARRAAHPFGRRTALVRAVPTNRGAPSVGIGPADRARVKRAQRALHSEKAASSRIRPLPSEAVVALCRAESGPPTGDPVWSC